MAGGGSTEERTEKATPRRRKDARRNGEISSTPEFSAWASMMVASFLIPRMVRSLMTAAEQTLAQVRAVAKDPDPSKLVAILRIALQQAMSSALPLVLTIALIAIIGVAGQGAIGFSIKLVMPKFSRMNPIQGVKRMFGGQGVWAMVKALAKVCAVGAIVYAAVQQLVPALAASGSLPLAAVISTGASAVVTMLRWAAAAGMVLAIADYAMVRKRNNKALKMTKQEMKDEMKSSEGDPQLKGARRSRAIALTRNRMFSDVKDADVVIVNPTHVAVALRYDPKLGAPRVVAKGKDHVAARVRQIAKENGVPMVADVPLARTLYASCDIGQEIPTELYHAVATVLAFLMGLRGRGSVAGVHKLPVPAKVPEMPPVERRRRPRREQPAA